VFLSSEICILKNITAKTKFRKELFIVWLGRCLSIKMKIVWKSKTKNDLIIEVWEKLDCESIGETEIAAIEEAVRDIYGQNAVDSPMVVARLLADEGAELRHSEIMNLHINRFPSTVYDAMFRNILKFESFQQTISSVRQLENLRRKFTSEGDKEGLRILREKIVTAKAGLIENRSQTNVELAKWLTIWLQTPEMFETWTILRMKSVEFQTRFVLKEI
jgi:hypothetical protein